MALADSAAIVGRVSDHGDFWDQLWLPLFPLASDDFARGVYRMERGDAIAKRHIEANPATLSNLLVVDIDHPDSALRALSVTGNHPMPTAIVENPRNGHAHAVWGLVEPVTRTERAHLKPLAYAAAVTEGLRRAVVGDVGYSGLMTKNPVHEDWITHWCRPDLYSLAQLEVELRHHMPERSWRRHVPIEQVTGLGRNCALFETSRHWAYREMRHWFGNPQGLSDAIHGQVQIRNQAFLEPLPINEATGIARSITRWITTKSRMWNDGPVIYDATFTLIQSARGRRSGTARGSDRIRQAVAESQGGRSNAR